MDHETKLLDYIREACLIQRRYNAIPFVFRECDLTRYNQDNAFTDLFSLIEKKISSVYSSYGYARTKVSQSANDDKITAYMVCKRQTVHYFRTKGLGRCTCNKGLHVIFQRNTPMTNVRSFKIIRNNIDETNVETENITFKTCYLRPRLPN